MPKSPASCASSHYTQLLYGPNTANLASKNNPDPLPPESEEAMVGLRPLVGLPLPPPPSHLKQREGNLSLSYRQCSTNEASSKTSLPGDPPCLISQSKPSQLPAANALRLLSSLAPSIFSTNTAARCPAAADYSPFRNAGWQSRWISVESLRPSDTFPWGQHGRALRLPPPLTLSSIGRYQWLPN